MEELITDLSYIWTDFSKMKFVHSRFEICLVVFLISKPAAKKKKKKKSTTLFILTADPGLLLVKS